MTIKNEKLSSIGLRRLIKEERSFARLLRTERECLEMSRREYGELLGMSAQSVADLENGRRIPSPDRAAKIATKLGYSVEIWVQLAINDDLRKRGLDLEVTVK